MTKTQQTILITGASDGIGKALALRYQVHGTRLVLIGRRPLAELDPAIHGSEAYCQADLSQPDSSQRILDWLTDRQIDRIDRLIHCAGIGYYGSLEQQSAASIRALIDINLRAPVGLTHALLPRVAVAQGRIVFISSVAAGLPAPDYAVYAASKAALEAFATNLRVELEGRVRVQIIAPGATRTAMHARSGAPLAQLGWSRFPSAELVAQQIERAIERGAGSTTIGIGNRLARLSGRHLGALVDWLVARRRR